MIRALRFRHVLGLLAAALVVLVAFGQAQASLVISGLFDAPLPGGDPKGVELTATADIADLSIYGLETVGQTSASNGVPDADLPAVSLNAGDHFYVTNGDGVDFTQWFGFAPDFPSAPTGAVSHNGDDTIILWLGGVRHDQFGFEGVDGTGMPHDTNDGWAYRNSGLSANGSAFDASNWFFSGANAWDGDDNVGGGTDNGTNAESSPPMPIGTFVGIPEPTSIVLVGLASMLMAGLRRRV